MAADEGENAEFAKYVNYDDTTGSITVDYEGANAAFGDNADMGALFDEYVS
jgi:hypothetical protein